LAEPVSPAPNVLSEVAGLWHELRELAHDQLRLAALETQQAGVSLAMMLGLGVIVAVLIVTAWLTLVAAGVLWMIDSDIAWPLSLLAAIIVNLVAATGLVLVIRRISRNLLFSATRRRLQPPSSSLSTG
jgi:uncharacterized membrane protein YqjE